MGGGCAAHAADPQNNGNLDGSTFRRAADGFECIPVLNIPQTAVTPRIPSSDVDASIHPVLSVKTGTRHKNPAPSGVRKKIASSLENNPEAACLLSTTGLERFGKKALMEADTSHFPFRRIRYNA
jgi:hypothetical protein